jgi:hypothetical protein
VVEFPQGGGASASYFRGELACRDELFAREQQKNNDDAAAKAKLDPYR